MANSVLEINLLTAAGKVERRLRCLAGRVNVLRGVHEADLLSYTRALAGLPCADRFSILINDQSYLPSDHFLLGFQSDFTDGELTVAQYLEKHGAPREQIDGLLLAHGQGGLNSSRCGDLTPAQLRAVQLIAAASVRGRAVILNDPFLGIEPEWLEGLAERLAQSAWKNQIVVVVINLSHRPECWIDNELIARIQIGGQRRRTIGFGAGAPELGELLQQVRAESGVVQLSKVARGNLLSLPQSVRNESLASAILNRVRDLSPQLRIPILASALLVVAAAGYFGGWFGESGPEEQLAFVPTESEPLDDPSFEVKNNPPAVAEPEVIPVVVPTEVPPTATPLPKIAAAPGSVLTQYPYEVANAILAAYNNNDSSADLKLTAFRGERDSDGKRDPSKKENPAAFLSELKSSDNSTNKTQRGPVAQSNQPANSFQGDAEIDRRREEIRQRFLEAIERSASQG